MILKKSFVYLATLIFFCNLHSYFDEQIKSDFLNKIKQETPQWITDQIDSDFKDTSPITPDLIDKTFKNYTGYIARFTICNGEFEIKFNKGDWKNFFITILMNNLLKELNSYLALPNADFLVVLDDAVSPEQCYVPVCGFCKKNTDKNIILIPDYQIFHALQVQCIFSNFEFDILSKVRNGNKLYPWDKKIPKAIWRGAVTGGWYSINNYQQFPRVKLVDLSSKIPNILDAKFSSIYTHDTALISKLNELGYMSSNLPITEHMKYKYQILIDGNTASWPGSYWRFHSNSVVLKQNSDYMQWYYGLLKPYVHYIPFANDVTDLPEKILWAFENDTQVQEIIKNANDMCAKCLTYADILHYLYIAIDSYAKLQNSKT